MSLGSAIFQFLTVTNPIPSILDRVYPQYDRQADHVYPLAVFKVTNVVAEQSFSGPTGFETADLTIAVIAPDYADADAAADAIQVALNGASGTWADLEVQGVFLKDDGISDDVVNEPQTEAIIYNVKILTFDVAYNRV